MKISSTAENSNAKILSSCMSREKKRISVFSQLLRVCVDSVIENTNCMRLDLPFLWKHVASIACVASEFLRNRCSSLALVSFPESQVCVMNIDEVSFYHFL